MDRQLCKCDFCGLELHLYRGSGSECPHCGGTFEPIREAEGVYSERYREMQEQGTMNVLEKEIAICDLEDCDTPALEWIPEIGMRCARHRPITFSEDAIQREVEALLSDAEYFTWVEAKLDEYE